MVEVIVLSNDSEEDVGAITPSRPNDLIELSDSEEIDVQNLTIVFFVGAAIAPSVSNDLAELNNSEEVDIGDMTIISFVGATEDHDQHLDDKDSCFNELHIQPQSPCSFDIKVNQPE